MPFAEFLDPVSIDKIILLLCRGLVLAPCISFVEYKPATDDKFLRMVEPAPVQYHRHDSHSSGALAERAHNMTSGALMSVSFSDFCRRHAKRLESVNHGLSAKLHGARRHRWHFESS